MYTQLAHVDRAVPISTKIDHKTRIRSNLVGPITWHDPEKKRKSFSATGRTERESCVPSHVKNSGWHLRLLVVGISDSAVAWERGDGGGDRGHRLWNRMSCGQCEASGEASPPRRAAD
jgi:hypothetical protein